MSYTRKILKLVKDRNPGEPEFHQAVDEILTSLAPVMERHPEYQKGKVLERFVEPERVIMFRVPWLDDNGMPHINRGFRVEFNSAIGPYKGGLRFHPTVNLGMLKFLGIEQVLKNSLTTLAMGGGKGGADFEPKGKSDNEIMRFCQSFMTELYRHIGPNTDIPAGDIGVGSKEIGYLFGQYKRIKNEFSGVLTGKGIGWGGSLIRKEATGYGAVYFAQEMLATRNEDLRNKVCVVSGAGNVAQHTVEKLNELGAKVVTLSDSSGFIYDADGINNSKLEFIFDLKNVRKGRIKEYADKFGAIFYPEEKPWSIACDAAFPCATQNELNEGDAQLLLDNGCYLVSEGANMPTSKKGVDKFLGAKILFGPSKAANAGGVATSGLEMGQNSMRLSWSIEEVDAQLKKIIKDIHDTAYEASIEYGDKGNYVLGANIAGFIKIADAMLDQGLV